MTISRLSNAKATGASQFEGILIAAVLGMCGSAIGRVLLQSVFDVLAKRDSSVHAVTWILGGVSMRFFVAHAIATEAFIVAYPRLPSVRRQLEGKHGTLVVGAALGTLMWVVLRTLLPIHGPAPIGVMLPSWLTMALFSGPIMVWMAQPYLATTTMTDSSRAARREIGRGWAVILLAVFVLIWTFLSESGSQLGIGMVFVGLPALAVLVVGTSTLLGGLSKARKHEPALGARHPLSDRRRRGDPCVGVLEMT
jgi:hypothetical protein